MGYSCITWRGQPRSLTSTSEKLRVTGKLIIQKDTPHCYAHHWPTRHYFLTFYCFPLHSINNEKRRKMGKKSEKRKFSNLLFMYIVRFIYPHTIHNNIVLSKRKRIRENKTFFFILYASSFIVVDKYTPEDIWMREEVRKWLCREK